MTQPSQTHSLSVKEAERKAFRLSTSQDGLYDFFFGAYTILLSLMPWLDENGMRTPWNVILVMALGFLILSGVMLLKKFLIAPRIGQVRYGADRKTVRNLEIVDIRPEENLMMIKGVLPGPVSGLVSIKKPKFAG